MDTMASDLPKLSPRRLLLPTTAMAEAMATMASALLKLSPLPTMAAMEATTVAMDTMASALLRRSPRLLLLPTMAMEAIMAMATMASALLRLSQLLNTTSPFTDTTGTMASAPLMLSPRQSPRRSPRLLLFPIMAMEATTAMATMASALLRLSRLLNTT